MQNITKYINNITIIFSSITIMFVFMLVSAFYITIQVSQGSSAQIAKEQMMKNKTELRKEP